jgi:hypothetical protein
VNIKRFRKAAPGLFAVLNAYASIEYGRSLDKLSKEEIVKLVGKVMPSKASTILRILENFSMERRTGGNGLGFLGVSIAIA